MRRLIALLLIAASTLLASCSGGGGASPAPRPAPSIGGAGSAAAVDQKITFTIDVPARAATSASARRRAAVHPSEASPAPAATSIATTPYVSPNTGSVVMTLAEIDGVSLREAAPVIAPINVPPTCQGSPSGCTIPVTNVPAALGIDRYFVQTYTGPNGTGNVISTGFVDVAVPVKANTNPAIGGAAALSIGGYVARLELAPSTLNFVQGTPSDASILVQALDPAGATIIGAAQYATAITLTLSDTVNFAFDGAPSIAVSGPLQKPLTLHYTGGNSFGALVQATSQDENGATVSASPVPANILAPGSTATNAPPVFGGPPPTSAPTAKPSSVPSAVPTGLKTAVPTPKPSPTVKPAGNLSLYVADGITDTVSEYRIASQLVAGIVPNPAATPSRVIKFDPTIAQKNKAVTGNLLTCNGNIEQPGAAGAGTGGVTVDPKTGTVFLEPFCVDGPNSFAFGYAADAVGAATPTIADPFVSPYAPPNGLANANGFIYASMGTGVYGFAATSTGQQPGVTFGSNCYQEFTKPAGECFDVLFGGIGADANGFVYVPAAWSGTDPATGDASVLFRPAAVLAVRATGTNPTVTPYAAIAGLDSAVGGLQPDAVTVDGSTIYALTGLGELGTAKGTVNYFPGLSSCPPPSANAPVNTIAKDSSVTTCADGWQHLYLAAYSISSQLLGPAANGTDVDLIPGLLVGGDRVGKFGCPPTYPGQFIAASGGFVYIINLTPTCDRDGNGLLAPEIDIYNTNDLSGARTDTGPVAIIPFATGLPLAVAIGPSGTVTGGQAFLRPPAGYHRPARLVRRPLGKPRHLIR